jgi:Fe-S-cluster-containing dehydrogenase component
MLIEVCGYDGRPRWIESSKVIGLMAKPPDRCIVCMACGVESEEWKLLDDADRVRRAVDEANKGETK